MCPFHVTVLSVYQFRRHGVGEGRLGRGGRWGLLFVLGVYTLGDLEYFVWGVVDERNGGDVMLTGSSAGGGSLWMLLPVVVVFVVVVVSVTELILIWLSAPQRIIP